MKRRATVAAVFAAGLTITASQAATIYVDASLATGANDGSSWADAFQGTIGVRLALSAAGPGDEIYVAEGVYIPTPLPDRFASFQLVNAVRTYGGFPAGGAPFAMRDPVAFTTALSGDLSGDDAPGFVNRTDNSYTVVYAGATVGAGTLLDGFSIVGGFADDFGSGNVRGGGMVNEQSQLLVRQCWFTENAADQFGGAVYNIQAEPIFERCKFDRNRAGIEGGAFFTAASDWGLTECTFTENGSDQGGAISDLQSQSYLRKCEFIRNIASSNGGAIHSRDSEPVVVNGLFIGNQAVAGGAISMAGGSPVYTNCTLTANSAASGDGDALINLGAGARISNCIFWRNGPKEISESPAGVTSVAYSIVMGGFPGPGVVDLDPNFVDPLGLDLTPGTGDEDLHLVNPSPAIDAGTNSAVPLATTPTDLDGNPRIVDDPTTADTGFGGPPTVDIGVYEYIAPPCPCDWNQDSILNSNDYFDFLTDFFNGNADFNNDSITNSNDYFDFLRCFFNPPSTC